MHILDGRNAFTQWDKDVKITADDLRDGDEIHFSNGTTQNALVVKAKRHGYEIVVDVPNTLLTTQFPIKAYRYIKSKDGSYTIKKHIFEVKRRPKPEDYVYTETERFTVEKAVAAALNEAKESGNFSGTDGLTPYIGENGNWWIGEEDTGVAADYPFRNGEGENSIAQIGNKAVAPKAIALGAYNHAGSKAYTIVRVDAENRRYYLDSLAGLIDVFDEATANGETLYYSVRVDFIRIKYGAITGYGIDEIGMPYVECAPFFDSKQPLDPERDYFQVFRHPELGSKNIGECAIVSGESNIANEYADVGGYNSTAGKFGFTRGKSNDVGYACSAFGELQRIFGLKNFGTGYNNFVAPSIEGAAVFGRNNSIFKRGFAFGEGLKIPPDGVVNKWVGGKYNAPKPNSVLELGNGSSDTDRKNIFEVLNDGTVNANGSPLLRRTPDPAVNGVYVEMRPDPNTNQSRGCRLYNLSQGVEANAIPERTSTGQLNVPQTPTADAHATSKKYVDTKSQEERTYTDEKIKEIKRGFDSTNYVTRLKQTATGYKAYVELGSKDSNGNVTAKTELKVISSLGTANALAQYNSNGRLADGKSIIFDKYADTELPNKKAIQDFTKEQCNAVKALIPGLPFKSANVTIGTYTEESMSFPQTTIVERGLYFIYITGKWGADSVNITIPCYISLVEGEAGYQFIKSFNNDDKPFAIYLLNGANSCTVRLCKILEAPDTFNLTAKIL